jgi:hypothetical protein
MSAMLRLAPLAFLLVMGGCNQHSFFSFFPDLFGFFFHDIRMTVLSLLRLISIVNIDVGCPILPSLSHQNPLPRLPRNACAPCC